MVYVISFLNTSCNRDDLILDIKDLNSDNLIEPIVEIDGRLKFSDKKIFTEKIEEIKNLDDKDLILELDELYNKNYIQLRPLIFGLSLPSPISYHKAKIEAYGIARRHANWKGSLLIVED